MAILGFIGVHSLFEDAVAAREKHRSYRQDGFFAIATVKDLKTNRPSSSRTSASHTPVADIRKLTGEQVNYALEMRIGTIWTRNQLLPNWVGKKIELECSPKLRACRQTGDLRTEDEVFWSSLSLFAIFMMGLFACIGIYGIAMTLRYTERFFD